MAEDINVNALIARSWSAHAAMINEAQALENAARRLREQAKELMLVLDPPIENKRDS